MDARWHESLQTGFSPLNQAFWNYISMNLKLENVFLLMNSGSFRDTSLSWDSGRDCGSPVLIVIPSKLVDKQSLF